MRSSFACLSFFDQCEFFFHPLVNFVQSGGGRRRFVCEDWAGPRSQRVRFEVFGEDKGEIHETNDIKFGREAQCSAALNCAANDFSDRRIAELTAFSRPDRFHVGHNASSEQGDDLGFERSEMFFSELEHGDGEQ